MADAESSTPAVAQSAPPPAGGAGTLQKPAGPPPKDPTLTDFLFSPMGLMLIGIWVFVLWMMRKQKGKEEGRKKELEAIKKGDRVITIGRLHGIVVALTEDTMTLKPDEKASATLTFDRAALWKVVPRSGDAKDAKEEAKTS